MLGMKRRKRSQQGIAELAMMCAYPWAIRHDSIGPTLSAMTAANVTAAMAAREMAVAGGVAIIQIVGLIVPQENYWTRAGYATSCAWIVEQMQRAIADPQVDRIKFEVDSPGGVCLGCAEASQIIHEARGTKPMIAHVRGLCASAAYMIASSADRIVAEMSSSTGSIGTIYTHQDWSAYLEYYGVKITEITHGQHKADGSPNRPLDTQGRETLQEWVTSYGEQFDDAVARNRDVTVDVVRGEFGQGKIYIAEQAATIGLIDAVARPQATTEELFTMNTTSTTNAESQTTEVATAEVKTETPSADNQIEKLTGIVTGLAKTVSDLEAKLSSTETEATTETAAAVVAAPAAPSNEARIDSMEQSLNRIEALIKHGASSSAESADGGDANTGKPQGAYRLRSGK